MNRTYTVYKGEQNGKLVYIGTTIQEPEARFRWHKANKKPFNFTVLQQFNNAEEMLQEEFRLIKLYHPRYNKIMHRPQNLNAKLDPNAVEKRKGDKEWCQSCLKRRVNLGYSRCRWCS